MSEEVEKMQLDGSDNDAEEPEMKLKLSDNSDEDKKDKSSDDSDENDELNDELYERAEKLESAELSYEVLKELVDVYKQLDNKVKLSETFKRFNERLPLSSEHWLQWIECEKQIAEMTKQDKAKIVEMFKSAVDECESVDVWLEYAQYSIGAAEDVREVFEQGLEAVGMDVARGSLLYDAYREYELAVLACSPEADWEKQVKRVVDVYLRQFSQPLMGMESTFAEWQRWLEQLPRRDFIDCERLQAVYDKSAKELFTLREYERKLQSEQSEHIRTAIYGEYMSAVPYVDMKVALYRRALAEFPHSEALWLGYARYLHKCGRPEALERACGRAVKLCSWSAALWETLLRAAEVNEQPHDHITRLFEEALAAAPDRLRLWLCYLEHFVRVTDATQPDQVRRLRSAFPQAADDLVAAQADPEFRVVRLWARVEAQRLGDAAAARRLWREHGVLDVHGHYASMWLELIELEQRFGQPKHVRRCCQRALAQVRDWPHSIAEAWRSYERLHGSAADMLDCELACHPHLERAEAEAAAAATASAAGGGGGAEVERPAGRTRASKRPRTEPDRRPRQRAAPAPAPAPPPPRPRILMDEDKQRRSVFLSNLDFHVTEERLAQFLGDAAELNLVRSAKGESRGYAYAVLPSEESVARALARDRERLDGRPVFVSRCRLDREDREPQFKYSTGPEQHKLFVRGLPFHMTEPQVRELFEPHGAVQEVRLVTHRSGKSKGLAYVEFKDAADAARAIAATDQSDVDGQKISVAVSAPPAKRAPERPPPDLARPRSRLQVPLVPRTVRPPPDKSAQPTLSNDDFRKMLLKKP